MNKFNPDYPKELIEAIKIVKGDSFQDEIRRDIDPNYLKRELQYSILSYVEPSKFDGKCILDFGCGTGSSAINLSRLLNNTKIIGIDNDETLIDIAKQKAIHYGYANLKFFYSNKFFSNDSNKYDFILLSGVHEHLTKKERITLMPLLWRKLKPNGIIFINQTPYRWSIFENHTSTLPFINYMSDSIAIKYAKRFSKRVRETETWHELLKRGIRGSTVNEIITQLNFDNQGNFLPSLLTPKNYKLNDMADLWLKLSNRGKSNSFKRLFWLINKVLQRSFGFQFLPYINIAVKKIELKSRELSKYDLLVPSIVPVWINKESYYSLGGFPLQINALTDIFKKIMIALPLSNLQNPPGLIKYKKINIDLLPLTNPLGQNYIRKLFFPYWLICESGKIIKSIFSSKAIYCPLPSDIGLIYLIFAIIFKKNVFVRHCGTWANKTTFVDRFIYWLLIKIASDKIIVMATGESKKIPDQRNPHIKWIFSTSFTAYEWSNIRPAKPWSGNEKLKLVYAGRLSKDKNVDSIIIAADFLSRSNKDFHIDILGSGNQSEYLKYLTMKFNLKDYITFRGSVHHSDVIEYFCKSHLFLFPTKTKEGFPKVLIEAMACGLPSIATRVSVIPFLINDKCGITIDQTDPKSVFKSIMKMINNPQLMESMGTEARIRSKSYTMDRWTKIISKRLKIAWSLS
tara:strand:- start:1849 stop:3900 length:2052 start_codon:yes stop_codon:yes gene_type:complete